MADTLTLRILRYLPKNLISRAFGWFASWQRPRFFVKPFIRWFAARFRIDLDEAARPIDDYPSLLAFFTRELKAGVRSIDRAPGVLVSPVDAAVGAFGRIESGRLLQAKGLDYELRAFVGEAEALKFKDGWFATLYLSPRDYHRIHSPVDGQVRASRYDAGTLWPVNGPAVRSIPQLFAVNERATAFVSTPTSGDVAVVMVGATNVGSIRFAYLDFVTNRGAASRAWTHDPAVAVERGAHLGTFELGSTVVLLVSAPRFRWQGLETGGAVRLGRPIGRYE